MTQVDLLPERISDLSCSPGRGLSNGCFDKSIASNPVEFQLGPTRALSRKPRLGYTGVYRLLHLSLFEVQSESDLASERVVRLEVGVWTFRLGVWANPTQVNLVLH